MQMFKGIVVLTVLRSCGAWALNIESRKRIDVLEKKVRQCDGEKKRFREMCGNQCSLPERADHEVLMQFGHVGNMAGQRMIKRIQSSRLKSKRLKERLNIEMERWYVKEVLNRGPSIQEGEMCAWDCGVGVKWSIVDDVSTTNIQDSEQCEMVGKLVRICQCQSCEMAKKKYNK